MIVLDKRSIVLWQIPPITAISELKFCNLRKCYNEKLISKYIFLLSKLLIYLSNYNKLVHDLGSLFGSMLVEYHAEYPASETIGELK